MDILGSAAQPGRGEDILDQLFKREYLCETMLAGPMSLYLDVLTSRLFDLGYTRTQTRKMVRTLLSLDHLAPDGQGSEPLVSGSEHGQEGPGLSGHPSHEAVRRRAQPSSAAGRDQSFGHTCRPGPKEGDTTCGPSHDRDAPAPSQRGHRCPRAVASS